MNIFEYMSFNPEWFLTVPGILITAGVVLLLIALIVLITSGKKDKDEEVQNVYENDPNGTGVVNNDYNEFNQPMGQMPINQNVQTQNPVNPFGSPVQVPGFGSVNEQQMPNMSQGVINPAAQPQTLNINVPSQEQPQPAINFSSEAQPSFNPEPQVQTPVVPPVEQPQTLGVNIPAQEPVQPVNNFEQAPISNPFQPSQPVEMPSDNFSAPVQPAVEPTVNVEPVQSVQEQPQPVQPQVSIYGGASPVSNFNISNEPAKPVIYGGADPLENTAPIPKVEPAPAVPQFEAKVVEPVQEPSYVQPASFTEPAPAPVVDNLFNTFAQQPVQTTPEMPVGMNQPVDNSIRPEVETLDF